MSDLGKAVNDVLLEEDSKLTGIVTTRPDGRTRFGISEAANPWAVALELYDAPYALALGMAKACLAINYGEVMHLRFIYDQAVATKMLSLGVNTGAFHAVWWLQEAVNAPEDGAMGATTLRLLQKCDPVKVLDSLCNSAVEFYTKLAKQNPAKYGDQLDGWLVRARRKTWSQLSVA